MTELELPAGDPAQHAFIGFVSSLGQDAVPDDVMAEARRLALDQIGCIVAARATAIAGIVDAGTDGIWPGGGASAHVYRFARLAGAMDFDEGYNGTHFGCGAISAALALADRPGLTVRDLLVAIVAGYEAGARIVEATGSYFESTDGIRRFLPIWGIATPIVYAAAAAAANLLRLDTRQSLEALSLAGAAAPIPAGAKWSSMVDLPNTKFCDPGWASVAGLSGALLAATGTTGLTNLLDAEGGLFTMISAANAEPARLHRDLGVDWGLRAIRYKNWPCCGMLFGAIECVDRIVMKHGLDPDAIDAVTVHLPDNTLLPRFVNRDPRTFASLQFSLPHVLAMRLSGIAAGPQWLDPEVAARPDISAMRSRVAARPLTQVERDEDIAASVTLTTASGHYQESITAATLAEPRSPSTDAEIAGKFRRLVAEPQAGRIEALLSGRQDSQPAATLLEQCLEARPA